MQENSNKIKLLKEEIKALRKQLEEKELELKNIENKNQNGHCPYTKEEFTTEEISRYSRQMILSNIGITGQIKLKNAKVLIVGIGGLGCPAALYLTAAGIGEITLIDYDTIDITNLHRQILHNYDSIGTQKVNSAYEALKSLNKNVKIIPIHKPADSATLKKLFSENNYDVVLDGSDNPPTRYLLNDMCVFNNVPLVSGSALKMEGQLTVYNYENGPCYRCLFPVPPPSHTITNCGDGGVLGAVTGVIGVLQALETIKIITGNGKVMSQRMLIFDGLTTGFMNVKLRGKMADCKVCGINPSIISPIDYERFCGSSAHDKVVDIDVLDKSENIDIKSFADRMKSGIVIDVRPKIEFEMCRLPNTVNIPYEDLIKEKNLEVLDDFEKMKKDVSDIYLLCRRGNDSQRALKHIKKRFLEDKYNFFNVTGGLHSYSKFVDSSFPIY